MRILNLKFFVTSIYSINNIQNNANNCETNCTADKQTKNIMLSLKKGYVEPHNTLLQRAYLFDDT